MKVTGPPYQLNLGAEEEAELLMQYFRDAQPLPMQKKRTLIEGPYMLYFLVEKRCYRGSKGIGFFTDG